MFGKPRQGRPDAVHVGIGAAQPPRAAAVVGAPAVQQAAVVEEDELAGPESALERRLRRMQAPVEVEIGVVPGVLPLGLPPDASRKVNRTGSRARMSNAWGASRLSASAWAKPSTNAVSPPPAASARMACSACSVGTGSR
jgi:hypothetical protein